MAKKKSAHRPAKRHAPSTTKRDAAALFKEGIAALGPKAALNLASLEDEEELDSHIPGWVSTQALALDDAIEGRGLPLGRIVEIFGPPATGKSTLALHVAAEVQRMGGLAAILDQEATLDRDYAKAIGVDTRALQVLKPEGATIEHGIDAIEDSGKVAIAKGLMAVLIWDTIAAAPSKSSLEERAVNSQPGWGARAIRDACRRFVANFKGSTVMVLIINQIYHQIGRNLHGTVAYGGDALGFYASVRLSTWYGAKLTDSRDRQIGQISNVTIAKSKVSWSTGRKVELGIARGLGIDNVYTLYTEFVARKLIAYGGSWATLALEEQAEPIRWQGGWDGLFRLCGAQPEVYGRLISAYTALKKTDRGG